MLFNLQNCRVKIWLVAIFFITVLVIGGIFVYRNHRNNVKKTEQLMQQKRSERESLKSGLRDLDSTISSLHNRQRPTNLQDVERDLMRRARAVDPLKPTADGGADTKKEEKDGEKTGEHSHNGMCTSCEKRDISVKALPNQDVCAFCKRLNEICTEPGEKAEMQEKIDQILITARDNQSRIAESYETVEETERKILEKLDRILNRDQKDKDDKSAGKASESDSDDEDDQKSKKRKVSGDEFDKIKPEGKSETAKSGFVEKASIVGQQR